jgi:hypothetical protein
MTAPRLLDRVRARLADETGVALVVAIFVSILMLSLSLALLAFTDQQTRVTGDERLQESSINLAEGALNAQANLLQAAWPESAEKAFVPCTQGSSSVKCPDPGNLLRGFTNKDFSNGTVSWNVSMRDNGLGPFYDDAATASQPAYDAAGPNGSPPDGVMWLRAQANVKGKMRTLVTLIRATPISRAFPRGIVTAGHFHTGNNGNKQMVDAGNGPGLMARCTVGAGGPARGNACLDYRPERGQVYPNSYVSDPAIPDAMSQADIDSLRNRAKAAGRWYANCPGTIPSAPLVFIENGGCTISSSTPVNSPANPGLLVINQGTLTLSGSTKFYGLIYAVNADDSTGNIVTVTGSATVAGAVVVDGPGGVFIQGTGMVLAYDSNVFNLVTTTQAINVIANSWRELKGAS